MTDGSANGVPYRIYCPVNATSTGPLAIGVYMHGGGYILGDLDSEDMLCRAFSEQTNSMLISVEYHLAPEHKHPAQLKDCLTVFEWVCINVPLPGLNCILTHLASTRLMPMLYLLGEMRTAYTVSAHQPVQH